MRLKDHFLGGAQQVLVVCLRLTAGGMQGYAPSSPTERECDVEAPPAMAVIRLLSLLLLMARLLISTSAANTSKSIHFALCSLRVTIARHAGYYILYIPCTSIPQTPKNNKIIIIRITICR